MPKPTVPYQYRIINHDLDGMHFCWNNIWHNWGNNQAYALLETFKITGDSTLFYGVNAWDYTFIPFLIENNFSREIMFNSNQTYTFKIFSQITYGMKSLSEITGKESAIECLLAIQKRGLI
jgi:hypothetical protein